MSEIIIAGVEANAAAAKHLSQDPVLRPLIKRFGPCPMVPHSDYYRELVESIIGQQLSVKAAATINRRFVDLFDGTFPTPAVILNKTVEELRAVGLSNAKAKYVQDLAQHVLDDKIEFEKFDSLGNEEIMNELLPVKGIGEWTAQMFLMFCMGRLDVLPVSDLGIRSGVKILYSLDILPTPEEIKAIAKKGGWHPYESIASWYIWQSLDN